MNGLEGKGHKCHSIWWKEGRDLNLIFPFKMGKLNESLLVHFSPDCLNGTYI